MFIGHYGIAFAAKSIDKTPSLGTMFLAVQWLDLLWPVLLLLGIEKFSIEPGNTVMTPLNFESYPWSHSMLMALVWSFLLSWLYYLNSKNAKGSQLIFVLVFSHWILDWITHRADLQFSPFSETRTGLGLWNYMTLEILIESAIFITGVYIFFKNTKPKNKTGTWSLWALICFLTLVHFMNITGPPPPNEKMVAWIGLSQWLIVFWGYRIDKNRV